MSISDVPKDKHGQGVSDSWLGASAYFLIKLGQ